jgi:hypothetical protein
MQQAANIIHAARDVPNGMERRSIGIAPESLNAVFLIAAAAPDLA